MRELRGIRIFLATIFFVASVAYLFIGEDVQPMAVISVKSQIIPSLLAGTVGVTAIWLVLSFILGRVYCSTVCPVGTFQDIFIALRKKIPALRRPYRYKSGRIWRYQILAVYLLCVVVPVMIVPLLLEPWNMMRNLASTVHPTLASAWLKFGVGAGVGSLAGVLSFILLAMCSLVYGRDYCNTVCPIGTALGLFGDRTLMHIEIDPDRCVGCLKCEDVCKSSCVKVTVRMVDNSRCVRCFDCLSVCEHDAIRYQFNRNLRPASPLMKRVNKTV